MKRLWWMLPILMMSFKSHAQTAQEEERRLHEIYRNFLADPITDEYWYSMFSALQEDVYVIQPGDTLWELSVVFFGDGHYWPKLWSVNSRLTNPHLVKPGYQIRFLRGGGNVLPQLVVEPTGIAPVENPQLWTERDPAPIQTSPLIENADGDPQYLLIGAPQLPPPLFPPTPLLKDLPESFPESRSRINFDEVGFSFQGRPPAAMTPFVALRSFITDQSVSTLGEVIEHNGSNEVSGLLQYIYLRLDPGYRVGDKFLAIGRSSTARSHGRSGQIYHIYGEVEITELIPQRDNLYRAIILESVEGVPTGAKLVQQELPRYKFHPDGQVSQVSAKIMGTSGEAFRDYYSLGTEVYLNRGQDDGLSVGDILYVTEDRKQRIKGAKVEYPPVYSAVAKVVHASSGVSTAVLVESLSEIVQGDKTAESSVPARIYPTPEQRDNVQIIQ
jgi:hypothetical protein